MSTEAESRIIHYSGPGLNFSERGNVEALYAIGEAETESSGFAMLSTRCNAAHSRRDVWSVVESSLDEPEGSTV